MLLNLTSLFGKYNLMGKVKGVIQVGAHKGQELDEYLHLRIKNMVFIEPCDEAFQTLYRNVHGTSRIEEVANIQLIQCACGDFESTAVPMYAERSNQGMSNSLLKPKVHLEQHKDVIFDHQEDVNVRLLDNLEFDRELYNFLNMDCQGFEDRVIKGGLDTLKHIDYIYTEVNREEMYENNALVEQMDKLLFEFERVETGWASERHGWGDAFYIRKTVL